MHLTTLVPGSLVPAELAAELADALQAPTLSKLIAHAAASTESMSDPGEATTGWIAREIFGVPHSAPTAPYAWAALTGSSEPRPQIWHADPIHITIGRESLFVQELAVPDAAEADALVATANDTLRAAGAELHRIGASWFLHTERDWSMTPRPLAAAIGRPLPTTPADGDALLWSRLHNEIQMCWHADPVNDAREARGRPAINAIWLHGGGHWSPRPALRWSSVHTERAELRGVAAAGGTPVASAESPITGDALLVWEDADACDRSDWSSWLTAMQRIDRRLAAVPSSARLELVFTGSRCTRTWIARPSDRYRVWRRTRLAEALAE